MNLWVNTLEVEQLASCLCTHVLQFFVIQTDLLNVKHTFLVTVKKTTTLQSNLTENP